ncbi:MAG: hypothetical protein M1360_04360 [Candidatus Marsarchaeota archaeon]|jgi:hypothetical protein|nr:hypothetical protein [Candidatus Marsarchaeota archaeon]MCL5419139.1 hypothetical protein [Candidatus Marsarchaeota archaeon]
MKALRVKLVVDTFSHVNRETVTAQIKEAGATVSNSDYDIVIIVGGDGTLLEHAPKYKDKSILALKGPKRGRLGSRGILVKHSANEVKPLINKIIANKYAIRTEPLLELRYDSKRYLTAGDFFVERGNIKHALRYTISVSAPHFKLTSHAISNGFIVTTPLGSTGYYAYKDILDNKSPRRINGIGIAHILPTFIEDRKDGAKTASRIRRAFPIVASVQAKLTRNDEAYLYGIPSSNKGIKVKYNSLLRFSIAKEKIRIIDVH